MTKKKDVGRFFYIHADLSGAPDVWKIGITISPYTAVRQRQKYMSEPFEIPYLYIGTGVDIAKLEDHLKCTLGSLGCGSKNDAQTELFKINISQLLQLIAETIKSKSLNVFSVRLASPYTAANSGSCPLGLPSEPKVTRWVKNLLKNELHIIDPDDTKEEVWDHLFDMDVEQKYD